MRHRAGLTRDEAIRVLEASGIKMSMSTLRNYEVDGAPDRAKADVIREALEAYRVETETPSRASDLADVVALFIDATRVLERTETYLHMLAYALTDKLSALDPASRDQYENMKARILARVSELEGATEQ